MCYLSKQKEWERQLADTTHSKESKEESFEVYPIHSSKASMFRVRQQNSVDVLKTK